MLQTEKHFLKGTKTYIALQVQFLCNDILKAFTKIEGIFIETHLPSSSFEHCFYEILNSYIKKISFVPARFQITLGNHIYEDFECSIGSTLLSAEHQGLCVSKENFASISDLISKNIEGLKSSILDVRTKSCADIDEILMKYPSFANIVKHKFLEKLLIRSTERIDQYLLERAKMVKEHNAEWCWKY